MTKISCFKKTSFEVGVGWDGGGRPGLQSEHKQALNFWDPDDVQTPSSSLDLSSGGVMDLCPHTWFRLNSHVQN